jgi:CheY-like chemotaxis protein/PAS domain-containing protein
VRNRAADNPLTEVQFGDDALASAVASEFERQRLHEEIAVLQRQLRQRIDAAATQVMERQRLRPPSYAAEPDRFADVAIEHAPWGCGVFRADGGCVLSNRAFASATGLGVAPKQGLGLWPWLAQHGLLEPARATLADGQTRAVGIELAAEGPDLLPKACMLVRSMDVDQPQLLVYLDEFGALLHGANSEVGQSSREVAPLDLEQVLQTTVDRFSPRLEQLGLEWLVDLAPELPRRFLGNARLLTQVLDHLVGNAVKFTEQGHVRVVVRELPALDPRRCLLRISVHDSGIGIDAARQRHLFEDPARPDDATVSRFDNMAPGLTKCRHLVELMDGRMGVESAPGRGSEFWFTAGLQRIDDQPLGGSDLADLAGLRVLLVDDGSAAGRVVESQLRAWQVAVARSRNALGAARQIGQARRTNVRFDVVLVDWQASDVDGLRALLKDHENNKGLCGCAPMMVMLSHGSRDARNRALGAARVDALLVKPVLAAPLLAVLRQARARQADAEPACPPMPAAGAAATDSSPAARMAERSAWLAGARVLLAEDNPVAQRVVQHRLAQLGLDVQVVANGAAALAALQRAGERPFDAVLMDLYMPVLDGVEATRSIRTRVEWAGLPVIAMTAAARPADRSRCLEAGMVDHLTKPVIPEILLDTLLRWIPHSKRRPRREALPAAEPVAPLACVAIAGSDVRAPCLRAHRTERPLAPGAERSVPEEARTT